MLWRQIALGLLLFGVYLVVDALDGASRRAAANRHGHDLFALEQRLHIDVEHTLNDWLAPHHTLSVLANYEYAYTYILSALILMAWVIARRPDLWRATRDSFIVLNLLAIATFAIYPTAPPRMLPDLGFVDTVTRGGTVGSWGSGLVDAANQVAAMPSLHVGWALWVSVVLGRISARRSVQLLSAVHVLLTLFVVLATANHYLLDAIAVVIPVILGVAYADLRRTEPAGERSTAGALVEVVRDGSAERIGPWLRRQSERWPVIKPYILAATEASASDAEVRMLFHGWVNEVVADIAEGLDLADRYPKPTRRYRGELAFAQLDQTALHWMRAPEEVDVDLAVEVLTEAWVKLLGDGR